MINTVLGMSDTSCNPDIANEEVIIVVAQQEIGMDGEGEIGDPKMSTITPGNGFFIKDEYVLTPPESGVFSLTGTITYKNCSCCCIAETSDDLLCGNEADLCNGNPTPVGDACSGGKPIFSFRRDMILPFLIDSKLYYAETYFINEFTLIGCTDCGCGVNCL